MSLVYHDTHVRAVVYLTRLEYQRLEEAARRSGEALQAHLRHRLVDSLPVSQTAARSGCAGDGEVPRRASPELGA